MYEKIHASKVACKKTSVTLHKLGFAKSILYMSVNVKNG